VTVLDASDGSVIEILSRSSYQFEDLFWFAADGRH